VKRFNIENFSKLTAILANAYMEEVRPRSGREAGLGHVGDTIPWMESVESCLKRRPGAKHDSRDGGRLHGRRR